MFIMWLGEQITERGIGNGMSLLIFAGIVDRLPSAVLTTFDQMQTGQISLLRIVLLLVVMACVVGAIVFVERGHRRISVQYAKRSSGAASTAGRARTFRSRSTPAA
jgi:preprotein translocase subunit SecY